MRAHQVMTCKVITVKADTPILEAANLSKRRSKTRCEGVSKEK